MGACGDASNFQQPSLAWLAVSSLHFTAFVHVQFAHSLRFSLHQISPFGERDTRIETIFLFNILASDHKNGIIQNLSLKN